MSDECDSRPEKSCEKLVFWGELAGCAIGEESGDGDANEGVECIPDEVEGRNLVGEEFNDEKDNAGSDDDPALERLQSNGKWKVPETGEESEDCDSGIEVEAGSEADGDEEGEELCGRNFQDVEHRGNGCKFSSIYYGPLPRSMEQ